MSVSDQPINLVKATALVLSYALGAGSQASAQLAPYVLTVAAALLGAWASAGDADPQHSWPRWSTVRYMLPRVGITSVAAVTLAVLLDRITGQNLWAGSLPLVAVVIAYIGPRESIAFAWTRIKALAGHKEQAP